MMNEKSMLMYWPDKGRNATIISAKMESSFGLSVASYSWVMKWLRMLKRKKNIFKPCERSDKPQDPLTGLRLLEFLNSTPLASIRQIATITKIPRSTAQIT
jgi:hypothetical protein